MSCCIDLSCIVIEHIVVIIVLLLWKGTNVLVVLVVGLCEEIGDVHGQDVIILEEGSLEGS